MSNRETKIAWIFAVPIILIMAAIRLLGMAWEQFYQVTR